MHKPPALRCATHSSAHPPLIHRCIGRRAEPDTGRQTDGRDASLSDPASIVRETSIQKGNPKKNKDRKKRKTFQIRIKTLSGIVRELEVHADMRVYELKERTMDKLGFQLDKQILIFGHEKLETPRKLSDYNISNGSELRLVVDLEGMARRGDLTDDDVPRDQPDRRVARRFLRRVCDNCGRQGTLKEPRFPVCYCGARRYCDETIGMLAALEELYKRILRLEKRPLPQMRLGPCFYGGCFELHRIFKV